MGVLSPAHPAVTTDDLARRGFSDEAIVRLSALRAIYPYVEFVESELEWQRLCFLKWRLRQEARSDTPA